MPSDHMVDTVRQAGGTLPPIVLFSDAAYAPMLCNWVRWLNRLDSGGATVVGYDQEMVDPTHEPGLDLVSPLRRPASVQPAEIVAGLVAAGLDVV